MFPGVVVQLSVLHVEWSKSERNELLGEEFRYKDDVINVRTSSPQIFAAACLEVVFQTED